MTVQTLHNIWNYFLELEQDMKNTSRYIEPEEQENVYSFEFAKLIVLSCTEVESVFKLLCLEIIPGMEKGNMSDYKATILGKYPKIVDATVSISRWGKDIKPFNGWDTGKLSWWNAYQGIKHNRGANFSEATYKNAVYALSALYVLIFYYYALNGDIPYGSKYIHSEYEPPFLLAKQAKELPDFE
ncbi:MAG: hypothetical protein IJP18_01900 [Oscillospiraceae bacterium]|nr:hypothetical protein [Oscillospiraceae bacterium]MBQ9981299.1 hypothetical protein [Oscillospiraceae bacterium]